MSLFSIIKRIIVLPWQEAWHKSTYEEAWHRSTYEEAWQPNSSVKHPNIVHGIPPMICQQTLQNIVQYNLSVPTSFQLEYDQGKPG